MAEIIFNPNKPSGIGVETATGERWITQSGWKFNPVTKELLPGQAPRQSLTPPDFSVAPKGGIEVPALPEGVTVPGAAPRDPVTLPAGGSSNNLNFGSPPPAEEVTAIAGQVPGTVTPSPGELFDITMPPQDNPLREGSDPVESHPEVAPAALPAAGPVPGKKSNRKG